jgi:DNA-binding MurR/RpiR family transcriptional regulator
MASLSPQERRAARALMADYPGAGLGTSADLANAAGVSPPTVIRFARAIGYTGFADLQSALLAELTDRRASPVSRYAAEGADGGAGHWLDHGLTLTCQAVRRSLGHIPHAEADAAVDLLSDTGKSVTCVGGRYSGIVAQYLAIHLRQLRPGVTSRSDAQGFGMASTIDAGRKDVYVIYDMRRYQRTTVDLARRLHTRGARIILITDPWLSPAASVAEVVLPTSVESPSPFDSMAPAFVLTELLIGAVLTRLGEPAARRMAEFEEASDYEMLP